MTARTFQQSANAYNGALAKLRTNQDEQVVFVLTTGGQLGRLRSTAKYHDMVYGSKTMDFDDGALYKFVPK